MIRFTGSGLALLLSLLGGLLLAGTTEDHARRLEGRRPEGL
jgi:hypothetical protein